ncbi:MAG: anaerobic sulfatase maturase [Bacteroidales bacterium]|nr:anaerobic sulfatase maturase [Bacteroidales bacterium]
MPDSSKITSFQLEQHREHIQRPFSLMVKIIGSICNLNCSYCYYRDKESNHSISNDSMKIPLLESLIRSYIESQPQDEIVFVWHGGEPTLLGLNYFKTIIAFQKKYANGKHILNSLQTNGTLIDDTWAEFLSDNRFLCGLSIDGPQQLHNQYRTTLEGKDSWLKAVQAARFFQKHGTDFNIMAVVHASNVQQPLEVYRFLKTLGSRFLQLTPIVERVAIINNTLKIVNHRYNGVATPMSENVKANDWGNFLSQIFDEWVRNDVGDFFVNIFDNVLAGYVNQPVTLCSMSKYCSNSLTVAHNGDVYSCDHFVDSESFLGNISDHHLSDLAKCNQQLFFEEDKFFNLSTDCKKCEFLNLCGGDCPKNRIEVTKQGDQKSILCEGYMNFFQHSKSYFEWMANEFLHQRPPSNIMQALKNNNITF